MEYKKMKLKHVKGNTWVLESWLLMPLYKVDAHRCILLDTGVTEQREDLDRALAEHGLTCVGVICSHAHMDHAGNAAYLQKKYGARVVFSLGEAGLQASRLGLCTLSGNSPGQMDTDFRYVGTACLADQLIWPQDDTATVCGVKFGVLHTPGHTPDHICIRTPDSVLYLGDAMMAGPELYRAKFPYAVSIEDYFRSLCRVREEGADKYIVAHFGIFSEIRPMVDLALHHLERRMQEILNLLDEPGNLWQITDRICRAYHAKAPTVVELNYYYLATQAFVYYLMDRGEAEGYIQGNNVIFRRTAASLERKKHPPEPILPPTGLFR